LDFETALLDNILHDIEDFQERMADQFTEIAADKYVYEAAVN
jgi:hypothetical protein